MRALQGLVVVMGVLIVVGVAVVAVTIVHRMGAAAAHSVVNATLDEPAGTHIVSVAAFGDRLAVVLQGGGPDRVAIVDPASGRRAGEIRLAR